MFCSQCGKELLPSMDYCPNCGNKTRGHSSASNNKAFSSCSSGQVLYESRGYPASYVTRVRIGSLLSFIAGILMLFLSRAKYGTSQMNIYAGDTLIESGTLGGGNVFSAEGQEWIAMFGIFGILFGVIMFFLLKKQNNAYALTLYPDRLTGVCRFNQLSLSYSQITEALYDSSMSYQTVTIITHGNKYKIIVTHDAAQAAEIINCKI